MLWETRTLSRSYLFACYLGIFVTFNKCMLIVPCPLYANYHDWSNTNFSLMLSFGAAKRMLLFVEGSWNLIRLRIQLFRWRIQWEYLQLEILQKTLSFMKYGKEAYKYWNILDSSWTTRSSSIPIGWVSLNSFPATSICIIEFSLYLLNTFSPCN